MRLKICFTMAQNQRLPIVKLLTKQAVDGGSTGMCMVHVQSYVVLQFAGCSMHVCGLPLFLEGVVGLACARALSQAGKEVVLVEQHNTFGQETSSRHSEGR